MERIKPCLGSGCGDTLWKLSLCGVSLIWSKYGVATNGGMLNPYWGDQVEVHGNIFLKVVFCFGSYGWSQIEGFLRISQGRVSFGGRISFWSALWASVLNCKAISWCIIVMVLNIDNVVANISFLSHPDILARYCTLSYVLRFFHQYFPSFSAKLLGWYFQLFECLIWPTSLEIWGIYRTFVLYLYERKHWLLFR